MTTALRERHASPHWTDGRGVDRVIEVGGAGTFPQSMQAITPAGEIAVIGFLASSQSATVDFNDFFLSGATFRVLNVGHRGALIDLMAAVGQSRLKPVIDSVHPFDAAVEAYSPSGFRRRRGQGRDHDVNSSWGKRDPDCRQLRSALVAS